MRNSHQFPALRVMFWLLCMVATLSLAACRSADDAPTTDDNAQQDSAEDDTDDASASDKPSKSTKDPERVREREEAEKKRQRFLDPELVQAIRAQSGLISLPPPNVERLLLRADLRDVMKYTGPIHTEALAGREPDSFYNAVRFTMGRELGCSVQRWVFPYVHDLTLHFDDYVDTLYEAELEPRLDAATYFSTIAGVRMVVMRHNASRSMIQLSCTESLLNQRQLRKLSERVISRL